MTKDEWDVLSAQTLGEWWGQPLDATQRQAWLGVLKGYSADQVTAALRRLLRDSPTFAPRLGNVIAVLEPQVPTFEEAWEAISPVLRNGTVLDPAEGVARCAELAGKEVAGWVATCGVRRLALEPVFDPEFGGAVLKRLGDSYSQLMETANGRELAAGRAEAMIAAAQQRRQVAAEVARQLPETSGVGYPE